MEKMSDVLRDFAQPLLDLAKNEEQTRRALCTAVIAWNLACLPEEERLKKLNGRVSRELGEDGVFAVSYLIERKLALYPHIHRPILDFEMTMIENGPPHLAVISEPEPGVIVEH